MAEIAVLIMLIVLDIRLPASGRILNVELICVRCMNKSLDLSVTIENVSVTSKALVGNKGFTLCSMVITNLTCFQLFATNGFVKEIVAITAKDLLR